MIQPGTCISGTLLDPELLKIAVFATPGATMTQPRVSRILAQPDPVDDLEMESLLPCTVYTTLALLATGFRWDEAAKQRADQFAVPPADAERVMGEVQAFARQYRERFSRWLEQRDGMPPIPPWEESNRYS